MRKRLFLAAVFMLALPILLSHSTDENLVNSAPFATVAVAGHVTSGGVYCECNGTCGYNITLSDRSKPNQKKVHKSTDPVSDLELGPMVMILALLVYFRMRA
jgi:hypothetical protein